MSRIRQNLDSDLRLTWYGSWISWGLWYWYSRCDTWPLTSDWYQYIHALSESRGCCVAHYARCHTSRSSSLFSTQCRCTNQDFLRSSCHIIDVDWTKIMVIYDLVIHPSVTIFLGWIQVHTCIWSLKDCDHIIPNKCSVFNERVGEWSKSFRVTSRQQGTAENRPTSDHLLMMVEITCYHQCGMWDNLW